MAQQRDSIAWEEAACSLDQTVVALWGGQGAREVGGHVHEQRQAAGWMLGCRDGGCPIDHRRCPFHNNRSCQPDNTTLLFPLIVKCCACGPRIELAGSQKQTPSPKGQPPISGNFHHTSPSNEHLTRQPHWNPRRYVPGGVTCLHAPWPRLLLFREAYACRSVSASGDRYRHGD